MSEKPLNEAELREELSAFMDGELDAERARFLQQRLSHDAELRALWERWQLASSALRRQAQPVPAGFAERVAKAIEAEPSAPSVGYRSRGLRWAGGAALAASLVIAGVFGFGAKHPLGNAAPALVAIRAQNLPIRRTELSSPAPVIKLPIPVESGVVTAYRSPLHPILVREPVQRPSFAPFPQPYAIDPELEAYLQGQKSGSTHDVFTQDAAGNGDVRTVAWPQNPQH